MSYCTTCGTETDAGATHCKTCASPPIVTDGGRDGGGWLADIAGGFVGGLAALVLGFVATAVVADASENRELVEELIQAAGPAGVSISQLLPEWYQVLSWQFLADHQVGLSVELAEGFGDGGDWIDQSTEALLPGPSELQLLPPLLLLGAGFLVAWRRSRRGPVDAGRAGASVVAGYLPGMAVIAYVASYEVVLPVVDIVLLEIQPDFVWAVLVAGIAYPVVFGGLGGLLALAVDQKR